MPLVFAALALAKCAQRTALTDSEKDNDNDAAPLDPAAVIATNTRGESTLPSSTIASTASRVWRARSPHSIIFPSSLECQFICASVYVISPADRHWFDLTVQQLRPSAVRRGHESRSLQGAVKHAACVGEEEMQAAAPSTDLPAREAPTQLCAVDAASLLSSLFAETPQCTWVAASAAESPNTGVPRLSQDHAFSEVHRHHLLCHDVSVQRSKNGFCPLPASMPTATCVVPQRCFLSRQLHCKASLWKRAQQQRRHWRAQLRCGNDGASNSTSTSAAAVTLATIQDSWRCVQLSLLAEEAAAAQRRCDAARRSFHEAEAAVCAQRGGDAQTLMRLEAHAADTEKAPRSASLLLLWWWWCGGRRDVCPSSHLWPSFSLFCASSSVPATDANALQRAALCGRAQYLSDPHWRRASWLPWQAWASAACRTAGAALQLLLTPSSQGLCWLGRCPGKCTEVSSASDMKTVGVDVHAELYAHQEVEDEVQHLLRSSLLFAACRPDGCGGEQRRVLPGTARGDARDGRRATADLTHFTLCEDTWEAHCPLSCASVLTERCETSRCSTHASRKRWRSPSISSSSSSLSSSDFPIEGDGARLQPRQAARVDSLHLSSPLSPAPLPRVDDSEMAVYVVSASTSPTASPLLLTSPSEVLLGADATLLEAQSAEETSRNSEEEGESSSRFHSFVQRVESRGEAARQQRHEQARRTLLSSVLRDVCNLPAMSVARTQSCRRGARSMKACSARRRVRVAQMEKSWLTPVKAGVSTEEGDDKKEEGSVTVSNTGGLIEMLRRFILIPHSACPTLCGPSRLSSRRNAAGERREQPLMTVKLDDLHGQLSELHRSPDHLPRSSASPYATDARHALLQSAMQEGMSVRVDLVRDASPPGRVHGEAGEGRTHQTADAAASMLPAWWPLYTLRNFAAEELKQLRRAAAPPTLQEMHAAGSAKAHPNRKVEAATSVVDADTLTLHQAQQPQQHHLVAVHHHLCQHILTPARIHDTRRSTDRVKLAIPSHTRCCQPELEQDVDVVKLHECARFALAQEALKDLFFLQGKAVVAAAAEHSNADDGVCRDSCTVDTTDTSPVTITTEKKRAVRDALPVTAALPTGAVESTVECPAQLLSALVATGMRRDGWLLFHTHWYEALDSCAAPPASTGFSSPPCDQLHSFSEPSTHARGEVEREGNDDSGGVAFASCAAPIERPRAGDAVEPFAVAQWEMRYFVDSEDEEEEEEGNEVCGNAESDAEVMRAIGASPLPSMMDKTARVLAVVASTRFLFFRLFSDGAGGGCSASDEGVMVSSSSCSTASLPSSQTRSATVDCKERCLDERDCMDAACTSRQTQCADDSCSSDSSSDDALLALLRTHAAQLLSGALREGYTSHAVLTPTQMFCPLSDSLRMAVEGDVRPLRRRRLTRRVFSAAEERCSARALNERWRKLARTTSCVSLSYADQCSEGGRKDGDTHGGWPRLATLVSVDGSDGMVGSRDDEFAEEEECSEAEGQRQWRHMAHFRLPAGPLWSRGGVTASGPTGHSQTDAAVGGAYVLSLLQDTVLTFGV